jgi:hypothetical protein
MKKRPGNPIGAPLLFVCHLGLFSFCILTCHFDFLSFIFNFRSTCSKPEATAPVWALWRFIPWQSVLDIFAL